MTDLHDQTSTTETVRDVVIIGSGPAGYTAAIYLGRAGYKPLIITGALMPGGQLTNTSEVENFPGFPDGVLGPELMDRMREQSEKFGAELLHDDVVATDLAGDVKTITCDGGDVIKARAVIVATGSKYRKLGVPGEEEFSGRGVSYCATCDGFFFKDQPIVVVGGGDSAMEEALFLTRYGSSVTLVHRRDQFRASQIMVDRVMADPKITVLTNSVVNRVLPADNAKDEQAGTAQDGAAGSVNIAPAKNMLSIPGLSAPSTSAPAAESGNGNGNGSGLKLNIPGLSNALANGPSLGIGINPNTEAAGSDTHAGSVELRNTVTGELTTIPARGIFVAIGHTPSTEFLKGQVDLDADGYIVVDGASTRTSTAGVFAAGDAVDRVYRQAISAAGMGCRAALDAQAYLGEA
ncbi:NAD(P)/FAD-dependent oxidoreductase [Bifidobacterium avesanii]|uniref:Thioredoxin-disulfide reductase n=1 Tax=Bifidobacterium avesanii TaxID=1798157 RepID=A0A7K3TJ65_9BIFI|nr:thioredoxin-disulfide reductase [Bifidobacterium avesanii]KAB8291997.1 thioredoxin reductase [Bifidobacterium avesanii]NEG78640.1 thioredoxin-disulfide reductase [Bifidobacterium avesanii]